MRVEFVNPFITALKNAISVMASIDLEAEKPKKKTDEIARGDISGVIGMIGPQVKGSMAITFDENLALKIMKNMLGDMSSKIDHEVMDMVGELTNMICGGAKNDLSKEGYVFEMALPAVISGKNHSIHHKVDGPKIILKFTSASGNAFIEICFDR